MKLPWQARMVLAALIISMAAFSLFGLSVSAGLAAWFGYLFGAVHAMSIVKREAKP